MPTSLVIGASRGLGLELVKKLHAQYKVFATVRSPPESGSFPADVSVLEGIDVSEETAGKKVCEGLGGEKLDLVIVNAGVFRKEVSHYLITISAPY